MKIILHTSQSRWGNMAICAKWHLGRGIDPVGYHYGILNGWESPTIYNIFFDGWLETGRPLNDDAVLDPGEIGAHTRAGGMNRKSIGVVLFGMPGKYTNKQIITARLLVQHLGQQFFEVSIGQHGDYDSKKSWCAGLSDEELNFIGSE